MKNLPVHPLAPRRKTPGQLHPHSMTSRAGPEINLAFKEMITNLVLASRVNCQGSSTKMGLGSKVHTFLYSNPGV